MGLFDSIGHQFSAAWQRLSVGHRIILLLLCVICLGGLVGVAWWASSPRWQVICADATPKECSDLAAALEGEGIQARISDSGDAVLVPASRVAKARMVAAGKGLPSTVGKGFDAFRNPKIGMTPFAERVNYVNALQGELATTITSLEEVTYARVHLNLPEQSLFKKDRKNPSASVLVATRGGGRLSARNAAAIANLVANAIAGLAPQDITISDGHGNVIAGGREHGPETAADDQWAYRRQVEDDLAQKAESMLTRVLGPGRCEVRVSAELGFQDSRETRREYSPQSRVVVSERIESSKSNGSSARVGGAAGTASNTPGGGGGQSGSGTSGFSQSENIDTRYVVGESVRETVNRGAVIERLAVAALVDLSQPGEGGADASAESPAEPATATMPSLQQIQRIVEDAVGYDAARGDSLQVVEADLLALPDEVATVAQSRLPDWAVQVGQYGAVAVLGLVLLFVARKAVKSVESATPRRVIVPEIVDGDRPGSLGGGVSHDELLRREIAKIVESDPRSASRLLEGWIETGE